MNFITFKGNKVALRGENLKVGDKAPVLKLKGKDLSVVEVGGKAQILLTMPSLDTAVCATEAREFNKKIASYENFEVVVITLDLPFAMGRFCSSEGIENLTLASDFLKHEFGEKYGVIMADGALEGLYARTIFVVKNGKIIYKDIVSEVTNLPDLNKLDAFLKENKSHF